MSNGFLPTITLSPTILPGINTVNILGMPGVMDTPVEQVALSAESYTIDSIELDSGYLEETASIDLGEATNLNVSRFDANIIFSDNIAIQKEEVEATDTEALFAGVREFLNTVRNYVKTGLDHLETIFPGLEPALAEMGAQNISTGIQTFFSTNKSDGQLGLRYSEADVQRYTGIVNQVQVESSDAGLRVIETSADGQNTVTYLGEETLKIWINTLLNTKGGSHQKVTTEADYRSRAIAILALGHVPLSITLPDIDLTSALVTIASDKKRPLVDRLLAFESTQVRELLNQSEKELVHLWLKFYRKSQIAQNAAPSQAAKAEVKELTLSQKLGSAGPTVKSMGAYLGWGSLACNIGFSLFNFLEAVLLPYTHWGIGIGIGVWAFGKWALTPLKPVFEIKDTRTNQEKITDLKDKIQKVDEWIGILQRELQQTTNMGNQDEIREEIRVQITKKKMLQRQLVELEEKEEK